MEATGQDPASTTAANDSNLTQDEVRAREVFSKRVLRKIDWRLLPIMFITYNLNFMDKTILSSASVFGLREDTVSPHHAHYTQSGT